MTVPQNPKPYAVFPDLPRSEPLVNKDGTMNDYWKLYFDNLNAALQTNFSNEGILIPSQDATNIGLLDDTLPNTRPSTANILYDSTNGEFKGNIAGTWKTFTLT